MEALSKSIRKSPARSGQRPQPWLSVFLGIPQESDRIIRRETMTRTRGDPNGSPVEINPEIASTIRATTAALAVSISGHSAGIRSDHQKRNDDSDARRPQWKPCRNQSGNRQHDQGNDRSPGCQYFWAFRRNQIGSSEEKR